ncbi:hypothetical protein PVK06_048305 [Gossypium arboreum]|uniref:Uncharacterized protein n=1 Tax=Gossypium arboreum TaxID=29729 RepID=A0ABR0MFQ0_GOSAR|nr:hypothetical protein PVK06_048305 [Gossypium arboreum]
MDGFEDKRILIDSKSVVKVLTWKTYQKIGLKEKTLKKVKWCITLPVIFRDSEHTTIEYVRSLVVDRPMAYNTIFGCPTMQMARIMIAIFCMTIKFPTKIGLGFVKSDQSLDVRREERVCKPEVVEVTKTLQLFYDDTKNLVRISPALVEEENMDLV